MEIIKKTEGTSNIVALSGRLDTTTSPDLDTELAGIDASSDIILDFSELQYISSAGLRVLLKEQKAVTKADGSLKIINVSAEIMEVFEITGFSDILTVE